MLGVFWNGGETMIEPNDVLIECDQPNDFIGRNSGHEERDYEACPHGSMRGSHSFPMDQLIPRSEWSERLKYQKETKSRVSDVRLVSQVPSSHQGSTSSCWAHSVVNVVRLARVIAGLPHEGLSASSVQCRVKNFQDVGGWSGQALEFIVDNGIVPTSLWPENSFKRSLLTPEAVAVALDYRVTEWWDFDSGDLDQLASFLLQGGIGSGGWNWAGHAMAILDLVEVESGSFGVRVWDNYGEERGDRGMYVLRGWKAVPDDHCGVRVTTVKS